MADEPLTKLEHRRDDHQGLPVVTPTRDGYMSAADKGFIERLRSLFGDPPSLPAATETKWEAALQEHAATPHLRSLAALPGLPAYANNAAAVAGGLSVGELYRTGGDPDTVCVVH